MTKLLKDLPAARKASEREQAKVKAENAKHTPGPWRWEFSADGKNLHLVGGRPRYDLTIMDFVRWGMQGGGVRMRDTAHDGLQLMFEVHKRSDWIEPFPGREHHANWCAAVVHPDMRLMAAAPDLLYALQGLLEVVNVRIDDPRIKQFDAARAAIAKAQVAPHE